MVTWCTVSPIAALFSRVFPSPLLRSTINHQTFNSHHSFHGSKVLIDHNGMCKMVNYVRPWCVVTRDYLESRRDSYRWSICSLRNSRHIDRRGGKEENIHRLRDKTKFTQSRPSERQIRKFRSAVQRAPHGKGKLLRSRCAMEGKKEFGNFTKR